MKLSAFFKERFHHQPVMPYLLLETIGVLTDKEPEASMMSILKVAVVECGLKKWPRRKYLNRIAARIIEFEQEASKELEAQESQESSKKIKKNTFGKSYLDHLRKMDNATRCMYIAEFDVQKARYLYCEVDKNVVDAMAEAKADTDFQMKMTDFEAVVFGMGGSFGGSGGASKDGDSSFDLSEDADPHEKQAGLKMMFKKMGSR